MAFDVYKAVGGTERMRVWTMNLIAFGFIVGMAVQTIVSLLGDRGDLPARATSARADALRRRRSCSQELWRRLRDYNRPDFHPDDRDTTELVEQWRTELFGDAGTLNDKLVKSAG